MVEFEEKPRLSELESAGAKIARWPYEAVGESRLYYGLGERDGSGFDFCAVEYVGCYVDEKPTGPEHPEARFDVVLHGWAAFDGVRHMYFRSGEEAGYFNYPRLTELAALLTSLHALEVKHCWDAPKPPTPAAGPTP